MEKLIEYLGQNPGYVGLFIAAVGALIFVGAICKWQWIIGRNAADSTVRTGLFGWLVYKLFGRRAFFIFTGAVIMISGIVWFIVMAYLV